MTTEERLEKLERELLAAKRRNRWLLTVMALAVAGMGLALGLTISTPTALAQGAGAAPKVIRANGLVLEDENGKVGAKLEVDKDGPRLRLYDGDGKVRAALIVVKNRPLLALSDENGVLRAILGATATATPGGKKTTYPESSLLLYGPDGKVIWKAPE